MQDILYSNFSQHMKDKASLGRIPLECQWDITYNCNLSCSYCYIVKDKQKNELSLYRIKNILDEIYAEGCVWLTFTGGEPLLRRDFPDIYAYAHQKGFLIILFTNGTLLDKQMAGFLRRFRPLMIELTLNGITEPTYESITRTKGSFKRAMQAIDLILENSLPLTIKTVGMTLNREEIIKIKDFAEKKLKAPFYFDPIIIPKLNGNRLSCRYRLSLDELSKICPQDSQGASLENRCREFKQDLFTKNTDPFGCQTGVHSFFINPYGYLKLCPFSEEFSLDLKKRTFKESFFRVFPEWLRRKCSIDSIPLQCRRCNLRYLCRICSMRAKLETADENRSLEFYCRFTHKSYQQGKIGRR